MSDYAAVQAADSYDAALSAFLEVPESPERPADMSPEPVHVAPSTETTAEPPVSIQPVQTTAQPGAEDAQVRADIEALLNRTVPATAEFPKLFHGQTLRKLVTSVGEQDQYITKTREQLQVKNDELIAAQATARVLAGQLQQRNQPAATVPPVATPGKDVDEFYKGLGMADPFRAFTENPEAFFAQVARGATAAAVTQIREEMGGRFAPLEQVVGDAQANQRVSTARAGVDRAFDQIIDQDKVTDPQIRTAMRDRFDRLFANNGGALAKYVCAQTHPNVPPTEAWVKAYRDHEQAIGGFMPLVSVAAALPTGTKANPPSSARTGASVAGQGQRTAAGRRSHAAESLLADSGFSVEDRAKYADLISLEIEGHLASGYLTK